MGILELVDELRALALRLSTLSITSKRVLVNNQTLRRLVRLAKIWNAKDGYIYSSYELERWITQQFF